MRRSLRMWNEMMSNPIDLATDDDFIDTSDEDCEENEPYNENLNAVNDDEIPTTRPVALVNIVDILSILANSNNVLCLLKVTCCCSYRGTHNKRRCIGKESVIDLFIKK